MDSGFWREQIGDAVNACVAAGDGWGCDRPPRTQGAKSNGLCNAHSVQKNRGQPLRPLGLRKLPVDIQEGCEARGELWKCDRLQYGRGPYCHPHLRQSQRRGASELKSLRKSAPDRCTAEGAGWSCDSKPWSSGYCATHYAQYRRTGIVERIWASRVVGDGKRCSACRIVKNVSEYTVNRNGFDGLHSTCRHCSRVASLSNKYGISKERVVGLFGDEQGECEVCGTVSDLNIDHDHGCCPGERSCGECVRGVLCGRCNRAIGLLRDDPDRLESAARYLRRPRGQDGL
ncbi:endonuclease domain-containing protein [Streptomyces sp. NPDC051546]|uniref:endonuclease domain-containing protein n=1 Tax=Streptomyces sp. NPDC051546 TaxID=3365655 RepID=UPI00379CE1BA